MPLKSGGRRIFCPSLLTCIPRYSLTCSGVEVRIPNSSEAHCYSLPYTATRLTKFELKNLTSRIENDTTSIFVSLSLRLPTKLDNSNTDNRSSNTAIMLQNRGYQGAVGANK